ncbi:MAG TPA: class II glutamine amidotransferase [Polyangia bacterium]|jgi:glutamine amidotransferase
MSRLFAYLGNDSDRVACALHPARKMLVTPMEAGGDAGGASPIIDSWGIGFYQGGEVLLQRRPKAPTEAVDFYAVARELRTDAIIGHVRAGTVGKPKNENTHPFRFRSWLFAHHGTLPDFARIQAELLASVPDFLRRNIRGQTDSEHLFHLFLSHLHEAGKLDDPDISTTTVRSALRASLAQVAALAGQEAADRAECALAVTNGRVLVSTRHGRPVHLMRVRTLPDCAVCRELQPAPGRAPRRVDHEHLRSVLIVADAPAPPPTVPALPGWEEIPDRSFVAVEHDLRVEITPIY